MAHPDTDVAPATDKSSSDPTDHRARPGAFESAPRLAPAVDPRTKLEILRDELASLDEPKAKAKK